MLIGLYLRTPILNDIPLSYELVVLTRTSREPFNTLYNSFIKAGSKTYLDGCAKSHANKQVQAWFKEISVKLLPLPTNSPEINPFEKICSEI